jgi:hypothetical protein
LTVAKTRQEIEEIDMKAKYQELVD